LLKKARELYADIKLIGMAIVGTNYRTVHVCAQAPLNVLDNGKPLLYRLEYTCRDIELQDIEIAGKETRIAYDAQSCTLFIGKRWLDGQRAD